MNGRVLLVDDDRHLLNALERLLSEQSFSVETAQSGEAALAAVAAAAPDLVVLDVGLPNMSGVEVCRRLRETHQFPILMLTGQDRLEEKVEGLDAGADDYVTKPFEPVELLARIRAILRRGKSSPPEAKADKTWNVGELTVDYALRDAILGGVRAGLTNREFELLSELIRNYGEVVTREAIFKAVWGYDLDFNSNSLDVYIYRLRKKIESDPEHPKFLHTLKGYGFRLQLGS